MQPVHFVVVHLQVARLLVSGLPAVGLGFDQQAFEEPGVIVVDLTAH